MTVDTWQEMNDDIQRFTTARVQVLEERIAKASTILASIPAAAHSHIAEMIESALEALEGK